MRLHPAPAFVALLLPFAAAAQTDEWLRDDMSDDALHLLRTGNLTLENAGTAQLPGSIGGSSQWIVSKGDGPAYLVYFVPGRIHEVEIDTHRLSGTAGDFNLAVSTDGRLYQPLNAGSMLLDSAFGWDYRLVSTDQVPENATHLLVQFPDAASAHRLSEVWIRFSWDDALAAPFLPPPVAPAPAPANDFSGQSDAELERMIGALSLARPPVPVPAIPQHAETYPEPVFNAASVENPAPTAAAIVDPAPIDPPMVTLKSPDPEETDQEDEAPVNTTVKIDIEVPAEKSAADAEPGDESSVKPVALQAETTEPVDPIRPGDVPTVTPASDMPVVEARIERAPADAVTLETPEAPRIEITLEPPGAANDPESSPERIVLPPFFLAVPGEPATQPEGTLASEDVPAEEPRAPAETNVSVTPVALRVVDESSPVEASSAAEPAPPEEIQPPEEEETGFVFRPRRIGPRSKIR